jgi:hypothetical protein
MLAARFRVGVLAALVLAVLVLGPTGGCTCESTSGTGSTASATGSAPGVPPPLEGPPTFTIVERPVELPEQTAALDAAAAERLLPSRENARIELVAPGDAPRRSYRHAATLGEHINLVVEAKVALTVETPEGATEMPVPSLRVALAIEVVSVAPRIRLAITVAQVELAGAEAIAAEMKPLVARLEGAKSAMELTPQGAVQAPPPPAGEPAVAQLWASVAEALSSLVIPLPSAPLGAGARFRVLDRVRRAGVVMLRLSEVTATPGPHGFLSLDATVREVALAEGARDPALGDEVRLEVIEGVGAGMRRVALVEGSPLPRVGASEVATDLTLRAIATKAAAEPQTSTIHLTQVLAVLRELDAGAGGTHGRGDGP